MREVLRTGWFRVLAWALVVLVSSYALGAWARHALTLRALWLGVVCLALAGVGSASAWFFLADANRWAQSAVKWRTVVVNVGGFLLTVAVSWTVVLYIAAHEWLR